MIKYGSHIIAGILLAPTEQLGITAKNIKGMFKSYVSEKSYPSMVSEIVSVNKNTQLVECYFCQGGHDVAYTYPGFTVQENVLSLRTIYHTCDKCQIIAKLNENQGGAATIKRIDYIIKQIKEIGEGFYLGKRGGEEIFHDAINLKKEYEKKAWTWDLTFLKRREMANIAIIESDPEIECPKGCYPPLLYSGFSSVKEFYHSKVENSK